MLDPVRSMSAEEICEILKGCEEENLIFDLDDTLYIRSASYERALSYFEKEHPGIEMPEVKALYEVNRRMSEEAFQKNARGEISYRDMLLYRTQRTFHALGVELSDEEALEFERFYTKAQGEITLLAPFREFFDWVSKVRPQQFLGIMTNGPSERQRSKIQSLGLDRWIPDAHIYISGDTGIAKPDARAYRIAEEKLNIRPENTLMIGDSLENDVRGALNAGWKALHLVH